MSILLEALRKSEEQRQLGTLPTLGTPVEARRSGPQAAGRWLPVLMGLLAMSAMTWVGWTQFSPSEGGGTEGPPAVVASAAPAATSASSPDPLPAEERIASRPSAAEAPPPHATPSGRKSTGSDIDEKRRLLGTSFRTYEPGEGEAVSTAPAAARAAEIAPAGPPGAQVADSAAAEERVRPGTSPAENSVSYWQLPASLRDGMPELRIRVLVYAARPEDRFVLVNDQRLREGEELEDGLKLEEIQRDQAIFSYRNYRFYLKG